MKVWNSFLSPLPPLSRGLASSDWWLCGICTPSNCWDQKYDSVILNEPSRMYIVCTNKPNRGRGNCTVNFCWLNRTEDQSSRQNLRVESNLFKDLPTLDRNRLCVVWASLLAWAILARLETRALWILFSFLSFFLMERPDPFRESQDVLGRPFGNFWFHLKHTLSSLNKLFGIRISPISIATYVFCWGEKCLLLSMLLDSCKDCADRGHPKRAAYWSVLHLASSD